jgi:hypothetical protein
MTFNETPDPSQFQQNFDFANLITTPGAGNHGPINAFRDFAYGAMDVRFDPSSPVNTNGDSGEFFLISITLRTNLDLTTTEDWDDVFRLHPSPADAGRWVTYRGSPPARQTNIVAFFSGLQGSGYTNGPIIANVDNLRYFTPPAAPSTNLTIYPFDTEGEFTNDMCAVRLYGWWSCAQSWVLSWTSGPTNQWDFFQDSSNASGSGSLRQYYNEIPDPSQFQQNFDFVNLVTTPGARNHGPINAFKNFGYGALDARIDPSSPVSTNGDYGEYFVISITLRTNLDLTTTEDWDDVFRLHPSPSSAGKWVTYSGAPPSRQTNVVALFTGLQGSGYTNGPIIMNVDNLRYFSLPASAAPTVALARADSGIEFVPAPTPARGDAPTFIMSIANAYTTPALSWMSYPDSGSGNPTPMKYELTIGQFPNSSHTNYVAHMIFAPYATTPEGWRNHPENDLANVIYAQITNNANGTVTGTLQYKTNAPGSGTNWQTLATVTAPSAIGTWSLTASNGSLTWKAPNGSSAGATLTADVVSLFDPGVTFVPLRVWLGIQPRATDNFNQMALFSSFKVSYMDSLTGVNIVTNETWAVNYQLGWVEASDCVGILPRPANTVYRTSWNGPATGFSLYANTNVVNSATWTPTGLPVGTSNDRRVTFIPVGALPGGDRAFFRLVNPNP